MSIVYRSLTALSVFFLFRVKNRWESYGDGFDVHERHVHRRRRAPAGYSSRVVGRRGSHLWRRALREVWVGHRTVEWEKKISVWISFFPRIVVVITIIWLLYFRSEVWICSTIPTMQLFYRFYKTYSCKHVNISVEMSTIVQTWGTMWGCSRRPCIHVYSLCIYTYIHIFILINILIKKHTHK